MHERLSARLKSVFSTPCAMTSQLLAVASVLKARRKYLSSQRDVYAAHMDPNPMHPILPLANSNQAPRFAR
jgi:hypothetical protein